MSTNGGLYMVRALRAPTQIYRKQAPTQTSRKNKWLQNIIVFVSLNLLISKHQSPKMFIESIKSINLFGISN